MLSDRYLKIRELKLREQELKLRRDEAVAAEKLAAAAEKVRLDEAANIQAWRRHEAKKIEEKLELKSKELELEAKRQKAEFERENAVDREIERFGDALRYSMVSMSDEPG